MYYLQSAKYDASVKLDGVAEIKSDNLDEKLAERARNSTAK
jgi:hypothetical protein